MEQRRGRFSVSGPLVRGGGRFTNFQRPMRVGHPFLSRNRRIGLILFKQLTIQLMYNVSVSYRN